VVTEQVVVGGGDGRLRCGLGVDEGIEPAGELRDAPRCADVDPVSDVRLRPAGLKFRRGGQELLAVEEDGRAGVLQDELELVGHEPPVERHHDAAQLRDREECGDELVRVHHQQGDPVTFLDPARQCTGDLVGPVVQLRVGEPAARRHVVEGLEVGVDVGALGEDLADVDSHERSLWHSTSPPRNCGSRSPERLWRGQRGLSCAGR